MTRTMRILIATACLLLNGFAVHAEDVATIAEAKKLPDDAQVRLTGKVVTTSAPILHQFQPGISTGNVQLASINEASGLAVSRKNAGVLWVHNDSGDSARVFAMSATGTHLGIYVLSGASATDWEDMCIGPGPAAGQDYLYLGDIGDNNAARASIAVYRVPEPTVSSAQAPVNVTLTGVQKLTLQYEDGARDAETLMMDPVTGDLYVVSKRETRSRVYRAAVETLTQFGTITLLKVAELPWGWATGGDISPRGDEIAVRGYSNASVWARPVGSNLWDAFAGTAYSAPLRSEPQGETLAYSANGVGYYTVSEGANQPIYYFARTVDTTLSFFYIQEPDGCSGIRVSVPPSSIPGLAIGKLVTVNGAMGTTAGGERQLAEASVEVTN